MYNRDTELIFPPRLIPSLRDLRGEGWRHIVETALTEEASLEQTAFVLMMARLANCAGCSPDTYRALLGCSHCATQTIRRYRGSDDDLTAMFQKARAEIEAYLNSTGIQEQDISK
ncbi:MAG: hypothetical protein D6770_01345 [Anaerolineae bacterium]|nr:MAG: hypothetical protein D6770_01345 [Anaerolineae bacterium]